MRALDGMVIVANKDKVLKTLIENREKHGKIVREAREGYVAKARLALEERLDKLKSGKIVSLQFLLSPPEDFTHVYDTAIMMLQMHTENSVELSSDQVRNLIQDEWAWMERFLISNRNYSGTAAMEYEKKNFSS